eukprot:2171801-Pyramimonas_sp.AAC.1
MQDNRAIIVLERGQEKLIFLGKGQVKMKLPEGSNIMPTTKLPSGHLSIRCDRNPPQTRVRRRSRRC